MTKQKNTAPLPRSERPGIKVPHNRPGGPPPDIMTGPEASIYLGMTVRALEYMRKDGSGPRFIKVSKRSVRYRRADLEAWLETRTVQTTGEARAINVPALRSKS